MTPQYIYRARPIRVIDGDTYVLRIDLGFRASLDVTVRLRGLNTPELPTPEGAAAKATAEALLQVAAVVTVQTHKDQQSFARWIADVWVDGRPLAEGLREAGHEAVG